MCEPPCRLGVGDGGGLLGLSLVWLADAGDRLVELEFAVARGASVGCVAARAVYRDDRRTVLHEKVNHLPARQAFLERQNLAVIDDRNIEALPPSAHINAGPHSHASKHAPLQYRPHSGRMQD